MNDIRPGLGSARLLDLFGRALLSALFLWSGIFGLVLAFDDAVAMIAGRGLPAPTLAAAGAAGIEIFGPLALFFRPTERAASVILAVYCLATALLFHAFWKASPGVRFDEQVQFFKDLALAGALLSLTARRPPD